MATRDGVNEAQEQAERPPRQDLAMWRDQVDATVAVARASVACSQGLREEAADLQEEARHLRAEAADLRRVPVGEVNEILPG